MTTKRRSVDEVWVAEPENWTDGPPHELFRELRSECPVHWSGGMSEWPEEAGYWSLTRAEDIQSVSRDWRTYSSFLGGITISRYGAPLEMVRQEFIAMDPPRHDRIKALFQAGFTPRRIAEQEPAVRAIVTRVLDKLDGRERCDLVTEVAKPVVGRVIGTFVGIPEEDDQDWADLINATMGFEDEEMRDGRDMDALLAGVVERSQQLVDARREQPAEDLASTLVHAEVEGGRLSDEEILSGIQLLMEAGLDSTKAVYCSGMRALMENPDQRKLLLDDPSLIPSAVEESLRMFPAFSHMRRTATCDTELAGQKIKKGDKVVMWYPSSGRDEAVYEDPDRFDVTRNPDHQAFGAGGRHFCLGFALARLELNVLLEETLKRYPEMEIDGEPLMAESTFINQLKTLPVKLGPRGS
ncbi:MAG TPA: cytochrome P450 [Solirubrobacterales bacterium]|nr:cytochrome P450 [Solirubrobacterales bacterium]